MPAVKADDITVPRHCAVVDKDKCFAVRSSTCLGFIRVPKAVVPDEIGAVEGADED